MENQIVTRARANSSQSSNPSADSVTPNDKTLKGPKQKHSKKWFIHRKKEKT